MAITPYLYYEDVAAALKFLTKRVRGDSVCQCEAVAKSLMPQ
jgi:hypothetical protein